MEVNKILEAFAKGEITKEKANELIAGMYSALKTQITEVNDATKAKTGAPDSRMDTFKRSLQRLAQNHNIGELKKISTDFIHQLSESVPSQIEKIQENVQDLSIAGFTANMQGISSKFSIFREFKVSSCSIVSDNNTIGSQWFGVSFNKKSQVYQNKFTAVQLSEVSTISSDLMHNSISLTRISHVEFKNSQINNNKITRATMSDTACTNSDFLNNRVSKSDFAQISISRSNFSNLSLSGVTFKETEFSDCEFENLEFENCRFDECVFSDVILKPTTIYKITDRTIVGKNFSGCTNIEAFLAQMAGKVSLKDLGKSSKINKKNILKHKQIKAKKVNRVSKNKPSNNAME